MHSKHALKQLARTSLIKTSKDNWLFFYMLFGVDSPWQCPTSPEYPGLQEQLYDPSVLIQAASAPQSWAPDAHSSISVKKKGILENSWYQSVGHMLANKKIQFKMLFERIPLNVVLVKAKNR